ncbi:hypothetical protein ES707_09387 [subsurface metagenome]
MDAIKLNWNSLLNLTELEFVPEPPKVLKVSDELVQAISWLTAATGHDRRLLRCTENGALLVADPWSILAEIVTDELYVINDTGDTFSTLLENKGVLIATSTGIVKLSIRRIAGGAIETIYVPPAWLYWYPHKVYSIKAESVPDDTGTESYVGITVFG